MCSFHSWKWSLRKGLKNGGISLSLWAIFLRALFLVYIQDQLASSGSWLSALKFLPWVLLQTVKGLLSFPVSLALFSLSYLRSCILCWVVWSLRNCNFFFLLAAMQWHVTLPLICPCFTFPFFLCSKVSIFALLSRFSTYFQVPSLLSHKAANNKADFPISQLKSQSHPRNRLFFLIHLTASKFVLAISVQLLDFLFWFKFRQK